jgi:hypothetical protein
LVGERPIHCDVSLSIDDSDRGRIPHRFENLSSCAHEVVHVEPRMVVRGCPSMPLCVVGSSVSMAPSALLVGEALVTNNGAFC